MKKYILTILSAALFVSCSDDFLDKDAQGTVSADQLSDVIKNFPEKALTIVEGAESGNNKYLIQFNTNGAAAHDDFGYMSVKLGLDHMTNDFVATASHWFNSYYMYVARQESNSRNLMVWKYNYKVIYNMNNVLSLIPADANDESVLQIKGRALAMRAQAYLDLIRLYGNGDLGIPYYSQELYDTNRVPTNVVYQNIENDLLEAYELLQNYTPANKQMISKNVVAGFLSRLYLTTGNNAAAAQYANAARQGYAPMNEAQLKDGFDDISNPEWMWGGDIDGSTSTSYASFFSNIGNLNDGYAGLLQVYKGIDKRFYDALPSTDIRKNNWFVTEGNSYGLPAYANIKFVDATFFVGDYVFMRAAEMYFNEAEALALSGNEAQAKQVLFEIMSTRDTAYQLSSNSGQALLDEIRLNKRVEMWGEGTTFFDMKRWNEGLDRTYTGSNHGSHGLLNYPAGSTKFTFQIPISEINTNPNIVQNPL
ncbi:RagB/SusD family nutrient uptake outer membrane protein [Faecalibacter bovis]|uniref:RagB/SusD family nutrient uptake outer membrane protein n=1 Tax=Faecalibacter bovis TaxID=2898187 RepID=A0ABX7XEW1_9FLAO|nr:RagB/SusD family nutrient uptake outer membrane protein [Faecalibacter bovis]MBS7332946.1 RagB/SusD family nutrient uptake outer membrane protein [Weeksellaceae bacterium]QTV06463.1 RagB/SusD family nutrient uptake outer membrane protein [Faecalibacter bovis]